MISIEQASAVGLFSVQTFALICLTLPAQQTFTCTDKLQSSKPNQESSKQNQDSSKPNQQSSKSNQTSKVPDQTNKVSNETNKVPNQTKSTRL